MCYVGRTFFSNSINYFCRDYLQLSSKYGGTSLEEYALSEKTGRYEDRIGNGGFGRNQMLWDFGLDPKQFENITLIKSKIEEIESTFQLVLLTEKFEESMILLKDLLCWDYKDMTSLKLNAQKSTSKSIVSSKARNILKKWMWADYMVSVIHTSYSDFHYTSFLLNSHSYLFMVS